MTSLKQLEASVRFASAYIRNLFDTGKERDALNWCTRIYETAWDKPVGIRIFHEFSIDLFEAVPIPDTAPDRFRNIGVPKWRESLKRRRGETDAS